MKMILHYLKKYKLEAFLAPLFKMIEAIFELLVPIVIAALINKGLKNDNMTYVIWCVIILFLFAILGLGCAIVAQYFSARVATKYAKDIKNDFFNHLETLSFKDLDTLGTSNLITNMTSDINQMQTGMNMFLRLFLRSPFVVFGALIMSFVVNIKIAMVFLISLPILAVIVFTIILVCIPLYKKSQAKLANILKKTRENITGTRVIRAFCEEENETKRFKELNHDLTGFQIFVGKLSALMNPLTYIVINLAIIAILYVGANEVNIGNILQGDLIAEYNYMSQILIELIKLANLTVTLTKALACSKRVFAIFDIKCSQEFPTASKPKKEQDEIISFEHVSMGYTESKDVLKDLSFTVNNKEVIGIIGGTGCGKTSLINLLGRYYDVSNGRISLYGNDIKDYTKDDLRGMVGVVMQKAVLFKGSIRDNLKYANPNEITDDDIYKALEIAQATDVIKSKENGLDEIIFEGGKNLSGGQRQRLCIARTLLAKPDILVLDDSSSALDYLTDKNLRKAILNMPNHPTLFIVSQRCLSVSEADKIIVLDEGKINGIGTHDELLKTNKLYQEIYHSQIKEAE